MEFYTRIGKHVIRRVSLYIYIYLEKFGGALHPATAPLGGSVRSPPPPSPVERTDETKNLDTPSEEMAESKASIAHLAAPRIHARALEY